MKIQIDTHELDQTTTQAVQMTVRYRTLIKDMRGFLGSQADDTDDKYLIEKIRDKASEGIIQEASKAMRQAEKQK